MISLNKLSVISGTRNEFKIWSYASTDSLEEFDKKNFFDPALKMFDIGDVIRIFHYDMDNKLDAILEYAVTNAVREEDGSFLEVAKVFVFDLKEQARITTTTNDVIYKAIIGHVASVKEELKEAAKAAVEIAVEAAVKAAIEEIKKG